METLKKLRLDHWAWLHAKLVMITWAFFLLIFTPQRLEDALGVFLLVSVCLTIILGTGLSIFGLFKSMSINLKKSKFGVRVELAGLWITISGPFAYMITQVYLMFLPNTGNRLSQVALAYLITAFVLVRIVIIYVHRKRVSQ